MHEFERAARTTGAFKGVEIDVLHETLLSWKDSPGDPYTVIELRDGKTLAAFVIISKITGRDSTFDIRYLVVDRDYRTTQGGERLLSLIDEEILARNEYGVIRFEASGGKIASIGEGALEASGYRVIGHILGYYGAEDDYYYLIKTVYRHPPEFTDPPDSIQPPENRPA